MSYTRKNASKVIPLLVLLSIATVFLIYRGSVEYIEYNMSLEVGNSMGANLGADALYFGRVPKDSTASRKISIANNYHSQRKVIIKTYGELKDWVYISRNNFMIMPGKETNITFTAKVPKNATNQNLTGKVRIFLTKF